MTQEEFILELAKLNIEITEKQLFQLEEYYKLLIEWNEKINLTGITEKEQVYLKHFYDSITLHKVIDMKKELSLIDIGTGAGFPGMVLKIVFPNLKITLLDSLNKRIEFLKEVVNRLGLENIELVHDRIEDYARNNREIFDLATARAVAPLNILLEYAIPVIKVNGKFLPMKANISREILESEKAMKILDASVDLKEEFLLPKENSLRTIISINKNKKTNNKYPRRYCEIKKKTL